MQQYMSGGTSMDTQSTKIQYWRVYTAVLLVSNLKARVTQTRT
jgi:hypothetical protein